MDNMPNSDDLIIYTDGGSRGNPGPSATGYVIMDRNLEIIESGGAYIGITTNNQAEYQAVKIALTEAEKYKPDNIEFRIDSLLVVNQMKGLYKIKNRDLWPINDSIKRLIEESSAKISFVHVGRDLNVLADQKVNEVLDNQAKQVI
jgi:ribonuclease HI